MTRVKPIIGVTSTLEPGHERHELWTAYTRSVEAAGGAPVILPSDDVHQASRYVSAIDGLILSGGQDLMPQSYGEEPRAGFKADWFMAPARDHFELGVAGEALAAGIPVLGICRGVQVLAVAAGGSLHQDVETAWSGRPLVLRHFQYLQYDWPSHSVEIVDNTLLRGVVGPGPLEVNSMHHQAVDRVPAGWIVSARAADGVVEAIEPDVGRGPRAPGPPPPFVLGVQWHPERLAASHPRHLALFEAVVEASAKGPARPARPRKKPPRAAAG